MLRVCERVAAEVPVVLMVYVNVVLTAGPEAFALRAASAGAAGLIVPDLPHDEAGEVRLIVKTMDWEAYVHLAFDEIRMAGAGSPQVARRLKSALNDLRAVAPPERVPILDEQLELLESATESLMADERDVTMALREDREGIGAAAGARRPLD